MKLPVFTKEKLYMALGVVAIMLVLWMVQRWMTAAPKPTAKELQQYTSTQMRRLPCGRFQKQTVEVDGPTGVKIAQILDRDGVTLLKEKRMPVDLDHCRAICDGVFVPELWKDCHIAV